MVICITLDEERVMTWNATLRDSSSKTWDFIESLNIHLVPSPVLSDEEMFIFNTSTCLSETRMFSVFMKHQLYECLDAGSEGTWTPSSGQLRVVVCELTGGRITILLCLNSETFVCIELKLKERLFNWAKKQRISS